jgi:hypothetical protein
MRPLAHHPHQMAHGLASLGRGNDSTLVHMTPQEVGGLRQLAMAAGGDLTINPHTGLYEAGFLSAILPMVAGFGLNLLLPGLGSLGAAALTGAADTAITGSWKQGLMAGLGAYGGASLAGGLEQVGSQAAASDASKAILADPATAANATANATAGANMSSIYGGTAVAPGTQVVADAAAQPWSQATMDAVSKMNAVQASPFQAMKAGIGNLGQPGSLSTLGSSMGKMGMIGLGTGVAGAATASGSGAIPANAQSPVEYYNTTYDPRTQTYSRGNWSTQFAGQGYTGAPGKDQSLTKGPLGSYANPYTSITAVDPYAVGVKHGGGIKALAAGGPTSSNLQDYYKGLMSGANTTSRLQPTSPDANNAFMATLGQGTAPTTPIGGAGMGFLSNQQPMSATNPYGYTAPPPSTTTTATPGATATPKPSPPNIRDLLSGNFPGMGGADGSGPAMIPTFSWDPATQSFTKTSSGYGGFGGDGKAAGGGIGSLNSFAEGGTTLGSYSDGGRLLKGPGDGMSDDIPANIVGQNPQPAALADGEFVIPADVVSHLGNGSTEAGSRVLYKMMDRVRHARTGNPHQGKQINPHKFIPV